MEDAHSHKTQKCEEWATVSFWYFLYKEKRIEDKRTPSMKWHRLNHTKTIKKKTITKEPWRSLQNGKGMRRGHRGTQKSTIRTVEHKTNDIDHTAVRGIGTESIPMNEPIVMHYEKCSKFSIHREVCNMVAN